MNEDKPPTDEDKNNSEPDTQEMTTLFSSDDTELTDFTLRVEQAIRGEKARRQNDNAKTDQHQTHSENQGDKKSSFKNNVVTLFKPK